MSGWIKLHRSLLKWEWLQEPKTFTLWCYILLRANHETTKWMGINIEPGQFITSREKLSKNLNMTESEIRTRLNWLKSTNEIAIETTSKYTIITIVNWELYQSNRQVNDQQIANKSPTNRQQIATDKNPKELKEGKEILDFDFLIEGMRLGQQERESFYRTVKGAKLARDERKIYFPSDFTKQNFLRGWEQRVPSGWTVEVSQ